MAVTAPIGDDRVARGRNATSEGTYVLACRAADGTTMQVAGDRMYPLPTTDVDPTAAMPPPAVVAEQFSAIQQRLRAMGATHYVLETWGPEGALYRFQCRMSAGHHPGYTRQFEAIDDDALRVMQTVLEEIDAWKAGRLP